MSSSTVDPKPRIVLCGSTSAYPTLLKKVRPRLEKFAEVAVPPQAEKKSRGGRSRKKSVKAKQETNALRYYFGEIQKSDAILVVNERKHKIEGYIGPNTLIEMAFAHALDKPIFLLNSLPVASARVPRFSELAALAPTILTGKKYKEKMRSLIELL